LLKEKEFVLQRMGSKGIQDKFKFKNKIKKQKKKHMGNYSYGA